MVSLPENNSKWKIFVWILFFFPSGLLSLLFFDYKLLKKNGLVPLRWFMLRAHWYQRLEGKLKRGLLEGAVCCFSLVCMGSLLGSLERELCVSLQHHGWPWSLTFYQGAGGLKLISPGLTQSFSGWEPWGIGNLTQIPCQYVPIMAHKEVSDFRYFGSYVAASKNDFGMQRTSLECLKHVSQHMAIKFLKVSKDGLQISFFFVSWQAFMLASCLSHLEQAL